MIKNSLAFIFILASLFSFAQDGTPKATWMSSPVTIDGKPQEWKMPLRFYDDGTKLFFAFANDDKNLYLCFQAPDDMFQMKIMRAGMEVTLSVKGNHKVSVTFPLPQQTLPEASSSEQETTENKNRKTSFILQHTLMNVNGFATRNGMIPINDSSGINAAINWDESNKLTYEIAIPFKEWFGPGYKIADLSKDISLDITINAVKQKRNNPGESGMHGGGGRMGNGGMHHQRNADSEGEGKVLPGEYKYSLYEKRKLKQKFVLAQGNDPN
jgi:hypothetical protein